MKGKGSKRPEPYLVDTLALLREHGASDQHDKVYAALGFATDLPYPINVDYNKSLADVLRDAAWACFRQDTDPLRLLGHAGMYGSGHLPATWMPDWFSPFPCNPIPKEITSGPHERRPLFCASARHHSVWRNPGYHQSPQTVGDTLKVPGILVDYIRSTFVDPGEASNVGALETKWILPDMDGTYAPTNEPMESAYLRTLVADLKMKEGEIIGRGGTMYWRNGKQRPDDYADVQQLMYHICDHRTIITTAKNRYIGLAPFNAQPDDAIFMLQGGDVLYIARPTLEGTYHYVGEAYIHGMMDGLVVDRFERGEGVLQWVELAPRRGKVLDSKNPQPEQGSAPFTMHTKEIGFRIRRREFRNPNEDMGLGFHMDVGPRATELISQVQIEVGQAAVRAATAESKDPTEAITLALYTNRW
jgi:hypothetical protein